jgi:hypothetical protein
MLSSDITKRYKTRIMYADYARQKAAVENGCRIFMCLQNAEPVTGKIITQINDGKIETTVDESVSYYNSGNCNYTDTNNSIYGSLDVNASNILSIPGIFTINSNGTTTIEWYEYYVGQSPIIQLDSTVLQLDDPSMYGFSSNSWIHCMYVFNAINPTQWHIYEYINGIRVSQLNGTGTLSLFATYTTIQFASGKVSNIRWTDGEAYAGTSTGAAIVTVSAPLLTQLPATSLLLLMYRVSPYKDEVNPNRTITTTALWSPDKP